MKHVVVVEDDPHNATLFRKVLEKRLGCRVSLTESPGDLFRLARSGTVDLVVMDVSLRQSEWEGRAVNGISLCRTLKTHPATAGIPVLLATAHAMRGDAERLVAESGADGYVAKPVVDYNAFAAQARALMEEVA
ncbi:MAG TPA: response regulator [Polyangiaceae bacterium]|nr:response regulator [Polyangiaceae bacterium]